MRTGGGRAQTDQWLQNLKRHTNALVYHSFTARYCADVPHTQHTTWSTQSFFTHLLNQSQTTEHTHTCVHTRTHSPLHAHSYSNGDRKLNMAVLLRTHTYTQTEKCVWAVTGMLQHTGMMWKERRVFQNSMKTDKPPHSHSLSKTQLPQEAYLSIHLSISIQILMKYMVIEEIWQLLFSFEKQAKESWLLSFSCTAPNAKQSALSACTCLYWMANSKSYVSYWWRGLFTILLDCC